MLRSTSNNVLKQVYIKIIHKYNNNIKYNIIKKKLCFLVIYINMLYFSYLYFNKLLFYFK